MKFGLFTRPSIIESDTGEGEGKRNDQRKFLKYG